MFAKYYMVYVLFDRTILVIEPDIKFKASIPKKKKKMQTFKRKHYRTSFDTYQILHETVSIFENFYPQGYF